MHVYVHVPSLEGCFGVSFPIPAEIVEDPPPKTFCYFVVSHFPLVGG